LPAINNTGNMLFAHREDDQILHVVQQR
jgi:hypothetical protein